MREYVRDLVHKEIGRTKSVGGSNVMCQCPFHKGGQERRPSFSVNLETGLWTCFTCGMGGGLAKLLRYLGHPRDVIDSTLAPIKHQLQFKEKTSAPRNRDRFQGPYLLPEELLAVYDYSPKALIEEGFDEELLADLQVGYDRQNRRTVWPLRDVYGNLIGLSGRIGDSELQHSGGAKYKVYKAELQELYAGYKRPGHSFMWNLDSIYQRMHRATEPQTLYITEGFKAAAWMMQYGFSTVAALMTTSISRDQLILLERLHPERVILFLDGDPPGLLGTAKVGRKIIESGMSVRVVKYPSYADQPDDVNPDELEEVLEDALPLPTWKRQLPPGIKQELREFNERKTRPWPE